MGSVYEARHTETLRRVAVKVIQRWVEPNSDGARRFRREVIAAAAVNSPHIVQVFDAGTDEETGFPYLVMEYLIGEDLHALVARVGPLHPHVVSRIAGQALTGLRKTHETGIVHRDIKPANLFLACADGGEITVKLLDFGIAKIVDSKGSLPPQMALTRVDAFLGSPFYTSPEQLESSHDVDHRTDLWSLGCTLYFALSARAPHQEAGDLVKFVAAIRSAPPRPVREFAPWVSSNLASLVHGALVLDPSKRHPSAAAMLLLARRIMPSGFALREEDLVRLTPEQIEALMRGGTDPPPPTSRSEEKLAALMAQVRWGNAGLPVIDDPGSSESTTDAMQVRMAAPRSEILRPSGAWTAVMSMTTARSKHTATHLEDGRVLVVGGALDGQSVEMFDPVRGRWLAMTSIPTECNDHAATLLADGRVLVAGGLSLRSSMDNVRHLELRGSGMIFDPLTSSWEQTPPMRVGRTGHTATRLWDGRVLVAGGYGTSAEIFDAREQTWVKAPRMHVERHGHAATLLDDGRVLITGGGEATAELFDLVKSTWSFLGPLRAAQRGHTATLLLDGRVLIAGGDSTDVVLFDPKTLSFMPTTPLHSPRWGHTATRLNDGRVLMAGGRDATGADLASAELFDPLTCVWTCLAPMLRVRVDHTATLLFDGRVLIAGGREAGSTMPAAEMFSL